jgi:hypothetical protein
MPAKKKPEPLEKIDPPKVDVSEDGIDFAPIIFDVVVEFGQPITPTEVAELTAMDLARVTELLDGLVTEGKLVLGDDQFYRLATVAADADLVAPPVPDLEDLVARGEVTLEVDYDDTIATPSLDPAANLEGPSTVVYLPSSDIVAFLKNINLPPQLIAGFGMPSEVHGFLAFEDATPSTEEPQPTSAFRVVLYGKHMNVAARLNPNQPGYVGEVVPSAAPRLSMPEGGPE